MKFPNDRLIEAAKYCHDHAIEYMIIHDSLAYYADTCLDKEKEEIENILRG